MPSSPTDPTFDVDRARATIESACPELSSATVIHLGRGWDNDVYLANGRWVFRFPRNEVAAASLRIEEKLLPWLAPQLTVPIPIPRCVGVLDETGWPFARNELVPGSTICDRQLAPDLRARLAEPLANFIRALHSIPVADHPVKLGGDPLGRFDIARRAPRALERLSAWRREDRLPSSVIDRLMRITETPPSNLPDAPMVIVHTDVHTRNVLVDERGELSGIIDWVDAHVGHRVLDYAGALEILPASARDTFFKAIGAIEADAIGWARWRAAEQTIGSYAGAVERKDERFARASRQALIELSED